MLTVLSVIGTRPEAIKMAPVVAELQRHPDRIRSVLCVSGQHRQMLDQVMEVFNLRADHDLNVMQPDQSLAQLTAALFNALDPLITELRPDWVLAQGDTTTAMVAALAAFYRRVKFGHVEAGLRTGDLLRPFPEEMNRRIADMVADLLFAPTERGRRALLREGAPGSRIVVTGNTVIDALLQVAARPYDWTSGPLAALPQDKRIVLITGHRRESFGEPFRQICMSIRDLATAFRDEAHFVYPVHLNPNVRRPVNEILAQIPNISLLEPLDYLALVQLMKRAALILTDSGGIQEEAPSLRAPVLVMREKTERPEGVEAGVSKLVGASREVIVAEATRLLRDPAAHAAMATGKNPYGDGHAAERIVKRLIEAPRP